MCITSEIVRFVSICLHDSLLLACLIVGWQCRVTRCVGVVTVVGVFRIRHLVAVFRSLHQFDLLIKLISGTLCVLFRRFLSIILFHHSVSSALTMMSFPVSVCAWQWRTAAVCSMFHLCGSIRCFAVRRMELMVLAKSNNPWHACKFITLTRPILS